MKIGIDIGGTFTDLVLLGGDSLNEQDSTILFAKTLTTYPDPTVGIMVGVDEILAKSGVDKSLITTIVHGTTLVTNAIIERKGAKTALITTKGFEDVLEIGRELRYDIYDIFIDVPKPLVPRNWRVGVTERLDKTGVVVTALDTDELDTLMPGLMAQGVESVAVCLLHSFANPTHEQQIGTYLNERYPGLYVSLSSDIMPEIREYERSSATVMNAYVQPITDDYLKKLVQKLQLAGFNAGVQIMVSSGKLTTIDGARKKPILLLESGPAGGAMASVFFGKASQMPHLLAFDMGGTTAKACLITDFKPEITHQFEAARVKRFKRGSGLPVRIPVIDLIEIGAGGGSIARINHLGLLTVGPDSAASTPGPACYGLGGTEPTVTDADLVLGYLDEHYFLGGTMILDRRAAKTAIRTHIADPLGCSVEEAALGIYRVVNENMANAARVHTLEKGLDPRQFSMIGFGGAGPVHAFQVARLLGLSRVLVPVGAGVTSALGFLVSPVAGEQMVSYGTPLKTANWLFVNGFLKKMELAGRTFLEQAGLDSAQAVMHRHVDMRYVGQGHEIHVTFPNGTLDPESLPEMEAAFEAEYRLRYGRLVVDMPIETVSWRVVVSGPSPTFQLTQKTPDTGQNALKGHRSVRFPENEEAAPCPVYDRYRLEPGQPIIGPAIIEEAESTIVVGPNSTATVDASRNVLLHLHA